MFRLDDQFLKDIGLDGLPEEQKKPFLQHIYSELELRVGKCDGRCRVVVGEERVRRSRDQAHWLAEQQSKGQ